MTSTLTTASITPTIQSLPSPPSDAEKIWYVGTRQGRWLLVITVLAFAGVAYSLGGFSLSSYATLTFLLPLALYSITILLSLGTSLQRRFTDLPTHERVVAEWKPAAYPSVDIFLPSAGEDESMLANTYSFIANLDWPGRLRVYALDDSARPSVKALAEDYGFAYLTRPDRGRMKKAGNLAFGYAHSDGDLIAIFDADFVPRAEYLHELVPYFDDPQVGIVQSPQFFDTTPHMNWLERAAGATQELFYRQIQPSRDRLHASICVGTCAVYRRSGLDQIGGFAQINHSEDVHTGVRMMAKGLYVRYIPVVLSKGVCPSSLSSFITQQYRWCAGSMSLLSDSAFHLSPQINRRQLLCFWSGFLYYLGTALQTLTALLPALIMVLFFPDRVFIINSAPLIGVVLLWLVVFPLASKCRWRPEVLRVQLIYGYAHLLSLLHSFQGSSAEWVPTNSQKASPVARNTELAMVASLSLGQVLLLGGISAGAFEYGIHRYWAMLAFAIFRAYIEIPVVWACIVDLRSKPGAMPNILKSFANFSDATLPVEATDRAPSALQLEAAPRADVIDLRETVPTPELASMPAHALPGDSSPLRPAVLSPDRLVPEPLESEPVDTSADELTNVARLVKELTTSFAGQFLALSERIAAVEAISKTDLGRPRAESAAQTQHLDLTDGVESRSGQDRVSRRIVNVPDKHAGLPMLRALSDLRSGDMIDITESGLDRLRRAYVELLENTVDESGHRTDVLSGGRS